MGFNLGGIIGGLAGAIPGIGTAVSVGSSLLGAAMGAGQMGKAGGINPQWKKRTTSPYAKQQLGMAQQLFNGRMAGAAQEEQNIAANQASQISNINRNATDSTTALAVGAGTQGQTNQAYSDLGQAEAGNKQSLLGNLNQAYQTMISEDDKNYQNELDKYGMDVNAKAMLNQSGANNLFGGLDRAAGTMMMGRGGNGGIDYNKPMTQDAANQIKNNWGNYNPTSANTGSGTGYREAQNSLRPFGRGILRGLR